MNAVFYKKTIFQCQTSLQHPVRLISWFHSRKDRTTVQGTYHTIKYLRDRTERNSDQGADWLCESFNRSKWRVIEAKGERTEQTCSKYPRSTAKEVQEDIAVDKSYCTRINSRSDCSVCHEGDNFSNVLRYYGFHAADYSKNLVLNIPDRLLDKYKKRKSRN